MSPFTDYDDDYYQGKQPPVGRVTRRRYVNGKLVAVITAGVVGAATTGTPEGFAAGAGIMGGLIVSQKLADKVLSQPQNQPQD